MLTRPMDITQQKGQSHKGHATSYSRKLAWWIIIPLALLTGAAIALSI